MADYYDILICHKSKNMASANRRLCSNVVLHRSSFGVPLILLCFFIEH